jgi:malate dehydrogenase
VQKRGAAVIEARGASSAASAANAVIDSVVAIRTPPGGEGWTSLAVVSAGQYGVPEGLVFGYPVLTKGSTWQVVEGLEHDGFAREKLRLTTEELQAERREVADLLA